MDWVTLASAIGAFVGSMLAYYRSQGNSRKIDTTNAKVNEVDRKVNGNLTDVLSRLAHSQDRSAQLTQSISDSGNVVPDEKTLL